MKTRFFVLAALLACALACDTPDVAYSPSASSTAPVSGLAAQPFANTSDAPGLEARFNEAMALELAHMQGTPTRPAQVKRLISGELWRYSLLPVSHDAAGRPSGYRIIALLHVRCTDAADGAVLWENRGLQATYNFKDPSLPGGMTELAAQETVWRQLARTIIERAAAARPRRRAQSRHPANGGQQ
jgi:hypothetical protein